MDTKIIYLPKFESLVESDLVAGLVVILKDFSGKETKVLVSQEFTAGQTHKGLTFSQTTLLIEFLEGNNKYPLFLGKNKFTKEPEFKSRFYIEKRSFASKIQSKVNFIC